MSFSHNFARNRRGAARLAAALVAIVLLSTATVAAARSFSIATATVRVGGRPQRIAVNGAGVTVYVLSPETTRHLLCTQANGCFAVWPPVKIRRGSRPAKARGVGGRLGILRRNGFEQLTLNGQPLYTFAPDGGRRGAASGNGIHSFGGVWHVLPER
jgi:predicted lipoprotein with Yx(FWY)xxD motif